MPAMPAILKRVGNSSKLSLKSHLYIVLIALEENNGPGHDVTAVIPITPSISPRSPPLTPMTQVTPITPVTLKF